jgi:hypothetical protein
MSAGDYLVGLALLVSMLAGVLVGAEVLVRRRLGHLVGAPRVVAFAVLATTGLLAVHLVPGMLGVLARGAVLVAAALWLGGALLVRRVPSSRESPRPEPAAPTGTGFGATAVIAVGAVGVFALATAINQLAVAPGSVDLLNFHLPTVARWIQSGSIWHVSELLPNVAPGAYPDNGDVVLLAVVLPWHDDFLAHLGMYPYYALTGIGVYALARELGATRAWAALAGALVLAVPGVALPALVGGLVDPVMLATFAAGLLFLARHHRTGARSDLVLAGLGLGISFGTKWYAVSAVAIVLGVWVIAGIAARRRPARLGGELVVLIGLVAAAGGIWLLRNWIALGDPFFPVRVAPLGLEIFGAPHDVVRAHAGSSILDYVGDWGPWGTYVLPQLRHALAGPAIAIGLGTAVGVGAIARSGPRSGARRGIVTVGLVIALLLVVAYAATPYTAGGPPGLPVLTGPDARYICPALVVGAAAAAAALTGTLRRSAPVVGLLALVAIGDGLRWSSGGISSLANLQARDWTIALALVGAAALAAAAIGSGRLTIPRPRTLAAGACALGVIAVVGGYVVERHYSDHRYLGVEPAVEWIDAHAAAGNRIGIAGVWDDSGLSPVLPAFGPRFGNRVAYVGREDDGFLRRYRSARAFGAALRRGRYDLLVVGLGRPPAIPHTPEPGWARRAGFRLVARSSRLALFTLPVARRAGAP